MDTTIDWHGIKERMELWLRGENPERPILNIEAPIKKGVHPPGVFGWAGSSSGEAKPDDTRQRDTDGDYEDFWTDFDTIESRHLEQFPHLAYVAETYPRLRTNMGVGSLALYLGCEPIFRRDTVWYTPAFSSVLDAQVALDPQNRWLQASLEITGRGVREGKGRYLTGFPDIVEHLDILSELVGAQTLLCEMMDEEEAVEVVLGEIQRAWFRAYDLHYDLIRDGEGYASYGPFQLLGKGRVAKLQCDMSAMISTEMFDRFAVPLLREQAAWLDKSLYHLDGVDALRHMDSVLAIWEITALQWTPGAGKPAGAGRNSPSGKCIATESQICGSG